MKTVQVKTAQVKASPEQVGQWWTQFHKTRDEESRNRLLEHMQKLSISYYDRQPTGSLVGRIEPYQPDPLPIQGALGNVELKRGEPEVDQHAGVDEHEVALRREGAQPGHPVDLIADVGARIVAGGGDQLSDNVLALMTKRTTQRVVRTGSFHELFSWTQATLGQTKIPIPYYPLI